MSLTRTVRQESCPQHGWFAPGAGECTCRIENGDEMLGQLALGEVQKAAGMRRSRQAASVEWVAKANGAINTLARSGFSFSSEDVRTIVGDPPSPGILGALFNQAARSGSIKRVGYVKGTLPSQHARVLSQWVGA